MKVVLFESSGTDSDELNLPKQIQVIHEPKSIALAHNKYPDADVFVVFATRTVEERFIPATLKLLYTRSAGTDHVKCKKYLKNSEIKLINDSSYSTNAVSEFIVANILDVLNETSPRQELGAKKVAIIGYGNIGRSLERKLSSLVEDLIIYSSKPQNQAKVTQDIREALMGADVIVVATALTSNSKELFTSFLLSDVKEQSILISISRPGVFAPEFLSKGLEQNIFRRVVLDVVGASEIWDHMLNHDKITYTRHSAWLSDESLERSSVNLRKTLVQELQSSY